MMNIKNIIWIKMLEIDNLVVKKEYLKYILKWSSKINK